MNPETLLIGFTMGYLFGLITSMISYFMTKEQILRNKSSLKDAKAKVTKKDD